MVMLHMFAALSPRPDFFVVTVNHNIRAEAQQDCEFVKSYCDKLGVECKTVFVDVPAYASDNKLSEETAARILRYEALDSLSKHCDYVCLAHHSDDNAETVLMHILRGSGARGASGIRKQSGRYLRPLINMTREEIEHYAASRNVPYVLDSTNSEDKYTRNFIRRNVMPLLKQLNNGAERNIVRFAENIAEDCDYLDGLVDLSEVEFYKDCARVPLKIFNLPKPLSYRTINGVFNKLGVYKDIERSHVDALADLASGDGGRSISLPFGFVATNDYRFITIERRRDEQSIEFEFPFSLGKTVTPLGVVEVSKTRRTGALMFDYGKLPSNAVIRCKRQGDSFTKFGGGTKSLKKYLIDKKIPQRLRKNLVLVAADNEAYVICGVEISDKVKVEGNSDVYYISIARNEQI